MAGEWRTYRIADVADVFGGSTPSTSDPANFDGDVPWLTPKDLSGPHGRYVSRGGRNLSRKGLASCSSQLLPAKSVLLSTRAPIGYVAIAKNPIATNQGFRSLVLKPGFDPEFVYYWLTANVAELERHASGSTFRELSGSALKQIEINVPPLPEQRAIAHILGTLDDKIELNRRMSETLEAMARALFKSWFIDFDPVRRNAARARNQPSPGAARHPLPEGEGPYRAGYDFSGLVETARNLRRKQTPAEEIFWQLVRNRRFLDLKFRCQHQLGDYLADFYCHEHRLVVEFDGGVHKTKQKKDHKRDAWMAAQGFRVLRFPNEQLLDAPETVLSAVAAAIHHQASPPSPPGRRVGDEGSVEELDRLFPDRLVDSELGPIPEGWEVKKLSDLCSTQYGYTASAVDEPVGPKFLRVTDINKRNWIEWDSVPYCKIDPETKALYALQLGDIVVARMADPGKSAIIEEDIDAVFASYLVRLKTESLAHSYYLYGFLKSNVYAEYAEGAKSGSVQSHMNAKVIVGATLVVPPIPVMEQFLRTVRPLRQRLVTNLRESRTLAAIRDALLPRLISGELRVKDAEKFLKERGL